MSRPHVARQIDDARPGFDRARDPLCRCAVWQRRKNKFGVAEVDVVRGDERHFVNATGSFHAQRCTALRVGRSKRERELGVTGNELTQLAPCVPACPEDSYWDIMHKECIIIHSISVNRSEGPRRQRTARVDPAISDPERLCVRQE